MYSSQTANHANTVGLPFHPVQTRRRKASQSSGSHAINALERKFQETLGEIKRLEDAEYDWNGRAGFALANEYEAILRARLQASLVSLENSIRLLCPDWNRKHLMAPKAKRQTRPLFPRMEFQKALISCLRRAAEPLTIWQIVEIVSPELGLPAPSADQRRRMRGMARSSLRGYYDKGFVDRVGAPERWFARKSQAERDIGTR